MTFALFLFVALAADGPNSVPVRDGCSEDASIVANVQNTDQMTVHHGVAGETLPCYAVSLVHAGAEVRGYVLGTSLPAVQEFEQRRARESRVSIPTPPPAAPPAEVKQVDIEDPGPLKGRQFEAWSGTDWNGKPIGIHPGDAKVTLVAFWRPLSRAARSHVQEIEYIRRSFDGKGVKSVGFIEGASVASTQFYTEDMRINFPQALDRSALAAAFGVDSAKGTTLVLDSTGKVVASSSDPKQIRAVVARLFAP